MFQTTSVKASLPGQVDDQFSFGFAPSDVLHSQADLIFSHYLLRFTLQTQSRSRASSGSDTSSANERTSDRILAPVTFEPALKVVIVSFPGQYQDPIGLPAVERQTNSPISSSGVAAAVTILEVSAGASGSAGPGQGLGEPATQFTARSFRMTTESSANSSSSSSLRSISTAAEPKIPEPAGWLAVGSALVGLWAFRGRCRDT